eukprot:3804152-Rhodomonas_salina.3
METRGVPVTTSTMNTVRLETEILMPSRPLHAKCVAKWPGLRPAIARIIHRRRGDEEMRSHEACCGDGGRRAAVQPRLRRSR